MAYSLRELRKVSEEELIAAHDSIAKTTAPGINYYLDELARREQGKQTAAILEYTKWLTLMTIVITIATIINVGILVYSLFKPSL